MGDRAGWEHREFIFAIPVSSWIAKWFFTSSLSLFCLHRVFFGLVFSVSSKQLQRGWSACRIAIKMHILIYLVVVGIVKVSLCNKSLFYQISALMLKRNEWVKQFTCSYLGLCCIYPIPFNSFKKHCIHMNVDRLCLVGSYLFVGCCLFDWFAFLSLGMGKHTTEARWSR